MTRRELAAWLDLANQELALTAAFFERLEKTGLAPPEPR